MLQDLLFNISLTFMYSDFLMPLTVLYTQEIAFANEDVHQQYSIYLPKVCAFLFPI